MKHSQITQVLFGLSIGHFVHFLDFSVLFFIITTEYV